MKLIDKYRHKINLSSFPCKHDMVDELERLQEMLNNIAEIAFDPLGSNDDIRILFMQDRTMRINRGEI